MTGIGHPFVPPQPLRRTAPALSPPRTITECLCPPHAEAVWLAQRDKWACVSQSMLLRYTDCEPRTQIVRREPPVLRARRGMTSFGAEPPPVPSIEVLRGFAVTELGQVGASFDGSGFERAIVQVAILEPARRPEDAIQAYVWAGAACAAGRRIYAFRPASAPSIATSPRIYLAALVPPVPGMPRVAEHVTEELGCPPPAAPGDPEGEKPWHAGIDQDVVKVGVGVGAGIVGMLLVGGLWAWRKRK